jgi:hypothetical protein
VSSEVRELEPQKKKFASRFTRSREAISWQPSISVWAPERRKGGQVASEIGDRRSQGRESFALQIHELRSSDREEGLGLVDREVTILIGKRRFRCRGRAKGFESRALIEDLWESGICIDGDFVLFTNLNKHFHNPVRLYTRSYKGKQGY